jgi:hypothetical protein
MPRRGWAFLLSRSQGCAYESPPFITPNAVKPVEFLIARDGREMGATSHIQMSESISAGDRQDHSDTRNGKTKAHPPPERRTQPHCAAM